VRHAFKVSGRSVKLCEKGTKFLEAAFGVVGKKVKKPEYHQRSTARNQQRLGG